MEVTWEERVKLSYVLPDLSVALPAALGPQVGQEGELLVVFQKYLPGHPGPMLLPAKGIANRC